MKLIDAPCEINYVLILFLKNMSHQKRYTFWYCVVNDEVPSTSSQIVEQIVIIQEVVLLEISKLNDSALDKKQADLTQLFPKKDSRKRKMDLILRIIFTNWWIPL